jgi:hypothetical protein
LRCRMDRIATPADAELILKLYDLRREALMRKAREWFGGSFWPQSFEEVIKIFGNFALPENAYLRQVISYWEMAASLVLRGALNAELFNDSNGEMYFVYAKMKPFLSQLRQTMNAPEFLSKVEQLAESTPEGRARLERIQQNLQKWSQMRAQQMQQTGAGR